MDGFSPGPWPHWLSSQERFSLWKLVVVTEMSVMVGSFRDPGRVDYSPFVVVDFLNRRLASALPPEPRPLSWLSLRWPAPKSRWRLPLSVPDGLNLLTKVESLAVSTSPS